MLRPDDFAIGSLQAGDVAAATDRVDEVAVNRRGASTAIAFAVRVELLFRRRMDGPESRSVFLIQADDAAFSVNIAESDDATVGDNDG